MTLTHAYIVRMRQHVLQDIPMINNYLMPCLVRVRQYVLLNILSVVHNDLNATHVRQCVLLGIL